MHDDLARRKAELASTLIRWLDALDAPDLDAFDTRPITATLTASISAGSLKLGGLTFDREPFTTRTETRRVTSARPDARRLRDLSELVSPADLARLDALLDSR